MRGVVLESGEFLKAETPNALKRGLRERRASNDVHEQAERRDESVAGHRRTEPLVIRVGGDRSVGTESVHRIRPAPTVEGAGASQEELREQHAPAVTAIERIARGATRDQPADVG